MVILSHNLNSLIKKIKRSINYKTKTNSYSFKTADVYNVRDNVRDSAKFSALVLQ